jgi:hypothetical protein
VSIHILCGYVKWSISYKGDGLRKTVHARCSQEMVLTLALTHHSTACRPRKEYGGNHDKLIVRGPIYLMSKLPFEFSMDITLITLYRKGFTRCVSIGRGRVGDKNL